jgi:hypothetical protein
MRKQDLVIDEMGPERDKLESNRTPKFLAWGTGDRVTSEVTFIDGLLSLESCLGRPMSRKSAIEGLSISRLADIQQQTIFSRLATFLTNSEEVKEIKSGESSAWRWWWAPHWEITVLRGVV